MEFFLRSIFLMLVTIDSIGLSSIAINHEMNSEKNKKYFIYIVKKGDTLSEIAKKFLGTEGEFSSLVSLNNIKNHDEISESKRLLIPMKPEKGYYQVGFASWYGPGFHGNKTASGEFYNMYEHTAAHRNLPLGSRVRVINLENGNTQIVKITDRGPYIKGRILDLSYASARTLKINEEGLAKVKLQIVSFPNLI